MQNQHQVSPAMQASGTRVPRNAYRNLVIEFYARNSSSVLAITHKRWPEPTEEQKAKIEQTAQAILDARAKYPDCSLADLYDEVTMPPELRKAHQENDRAVMAAYGFKPGQTSESECVAELFKMYQELTK